MIVAVGVLSRRLKLQVFDTNLLGRVHGLEQVPKTADPGSATNAWVEIAWEVRVTVGVRFAHASSVDAVEQQLLNKS